MQDLAPERQALQYVCILFLVVVREARAALAHLDRERALGVLRLRGMEVRLQMLDHAFARVAIRAQERVVVADRVDALSYVLLAEPLALVLARERLDGTLLNFDILLNLTPGATFGVDLLRGERNEVITEEVGSIVRFEYVVNTLYRLHA